MYTKSNKGITSPGGFEAAGVHCGVKRAKKDIALIYSGVQTFTSVMFTKNSVQAAPLLVNQVQLKKGAGCRAIVINSGNANACTGEKGLEDSWEMVRSTARAMNLSEDEVLVASTGVIGQYLPMEKIVCGISKAASALSGEGHTDAAEAIMTTDTFIKEYAVRVNINGVEATIGGMAKGSGMIAPNMATTLGFVTTDIRIAPKLLQHALREAVNRSFNRISVDGDTSTNDMVAILANGMAGNDEISELSDPSYTVFYDALEHLLVELSKMIVLDGEGATKFIELCLMGASSEESAVRAAKSIANSNLVKTAIHGEDANWGRILAALGYSGVAFNPAEVEIFFGDVPILKKNYLIDFSEERAKSVLRGKEIKITVDMHQGNASASFWTCDLSKEYITINANYRT